MAELLEEPYLVQSWVMLEQVLARYGVDSHEVVGRCRGNQLEGLLLRHPFYEREVPVILGEHVTTEACQESEDCC